MALCLGASHGRGIDLEHHPEGLLALPAAAVLAALDLSLGRDALLSEDAPKGFSTDSDPFRFPRISQRCVSLISRYLPRANSITFLRVASGTLLGLSLFLFP